jgi:uncharacterized protein YndB with AHSA1/START domain
MNPDASVLKVRRSIHIAAAPARVWDAFASIETMRRWWGHTEGDPLAGQGHGQWLDAYEPRVGGAVRMAVSFDGARTAYGGEIVTFDEAREWTFQNDWIPNRGWAAPTYVTVRLTPALNGTLVELFHHGFERTGGDIAAEHAGYEQGWGMLQLRRLKEISEMQP